MNTEKIFENCPELQLYTKMPFAEGKEILTSIDLISTNIQSQIDELDNKYNPKIDITLQYFNIGDLVYYINPYGIIVPAIIDAISNFRHTDTRGGLVYYWIILENCKLSLYNKIIYWLVTTIPWLPLKHKIPDCFPGHAVSPGDDIFRTKDDAIQAQLLFSTKYNLIDYKNMLIRTNKI